MVTLPVILFPAAILFLLLTPSAGSPDIADSSHRRCIAVRAQMSEVLELEERELLKDTRTSFIPPSQPLILPPYCKQPPSPSVPPSNDVKIYHELKLLNYIHRRRRRANFTASHSFWKGEGSLKNIRATQAEVMKQYIDATVDPCVDFYQYACGNWEKLNPIPKDKAAFDTFEKLRESLDLVLRDLLTEEDDQEKLENGLELSQVLLEDVLMDKRSVQPITAESKARHLFKSCMNYELLEERGIEPLLDLLKSLGGWPALDPDWDETNFDWLNLTAQLRLYNNDIFIVEWVGPDIKNSDENVVQFDQTSLGLPTRDYFLKDSNSAYLEAYREYMSTVLHLLGAEYLHATKTANEIIDFEVRLANITSSPEERSNVSVLYRRLTLDALSREIPQIRWQQYLAAVLERPIPTNETVVIFAMEYMHNLVALIANTEPRTVANYLFWRFLRHRVNNVDDRFNDAKQKFYFALFGREESPPRWKNCINQVNSNMGMAVGAMFVRRYFDENSKRDTMDMTHELQQSFREILESTDWIDFSTKQLAELKVNAMSLRIGYPDYILSHDELNAKYQDLGEYGRLLTKAFNFWCPND